MEGTYVSQGSSIGFASALGWTRSSEAVVLERIEVSRSSGLEWLGAIVVPADATPSGLHAQYGRFPPAEFDGLWSPLEGYRLEAGDEVHIIMGFRVTTDEVTGFADPPIHYRAAGRPYRRLYDYTARLCPERLRETEGTCDAGPIPSLIASAP